MTIHEINFPQITPEIQNVYALNSPSACPTNVRSLAFLRAIRIRMINECHRVLRIQNYDITRQDYSTLKRHILDTLNSTGMWFDNHPLTNETMQPNLNITFYYIKDNITDTFANIDNDSDLHDEKQISVGLMFNRYHRVRIFKTENNLVIVSNRSITDNDILLKICAALPAIYPSISEYIPVTVFRNLLAPDSTEWYNEMNTYLMQQQETWSSLNTQAVIKLFTAQQTERITSAKRELKRRQDEYTSYCQALMEVSKQIESASQTLWGMENAETKDDAIKEMLAYANKHPNIVDISESDGWLHITVTTTLSLYDEDMAKRILKRNIESYDKGTQYYTGLLAMQKIFIDHEATFRIAETVRLSLGGSIRGLRAPEQLQGIQNPHHLFFNCWGSYPTHIFKALSNWQLIPMLEQIHSATRALNWADGAVCGRFMDAFKGTYGGDNIQSTPCIQVNGEATIYSIQEYRRKIKEELKNETN